MPKKLSSFLKSLAGGFAEPFSDRAVSEPATPDATGNKLWGRILARNNVPDALKAAMEIDGALGVALVDYNSGLTLGIDGAGPDKNLEVAAAGNADVVKGEMKTMSELGLDERIEDIVITLDTQVHLIRPVAHTDGDGLFVYVALDKSASYLAIARRDLHSIEDALLS